MDEFGDTAAVGEVGDAQRGMEIMGEYTRGDDRMQMCYAFEFLSPEAPSGRRVGAGAAQVRDGRPPTAGPAGPSPTTTSSGTRRAGSSTPAQLRVYLALLLSLRGSVCLYQGEELGLTEAYVPFEDLQDPYGKRFWPKFRGRDGCRTPMVWLSDNMNGGFSEAKPWLPVAMEHLRDGGQRRRRTTRSSMLAFYRRMLAWRKARPALAKGGFAICTRPRTA